MSWKLTGRLWSFLNGALLAFAVTFYVESQFIATQVKYIVGSVATADMSKEQVALALLHETDAIVDFGLRHADSSKLVLNQRLPLRSFDESMLLPTGECGDATGILYRLLSEAGIAARIAQMRCGDRWGCHIYIEADIGGRWVVLDPLFGVAFRNKNNELATFSEVSADWQYFRNQTPADYHQDLQYEGVRYTNWEKIPILMPFLRRVLVVVLGEKRTNGISLRTYVMAPNRIYFAGCVVGLLLVNGVGLAIRRRWRG